jgi:putative flippase GtrA
VSANVKTAKQFVRYCIVGGSGALINLVLVYLLTTYVFGDSFWFMPGYIASTAVSTALIFMWNFAGNKAWTFSDKATLHPFSVAERVVMSVARKDKVKKE